jgi:hypothetical protein
MAAPPLLDAPVVILAFDRPDYLDRLCAALAAQQGARLDPARVHLVQDGAVSPRSGERYAADDRLAASIAAFRQHFPAGQVHAARENHGIALNWLRAERLAFVALKAELAYFFEEDLEPGPWYLAVLEQIRAAAAGAPLGYFAAYGARGASGTPGRPTLVGLDHHWGVGLTRACWLAMQPWLGPFLDIWAGCDYQGRPHLPLLGCYRDKAVAAGVSSQDAAKAAACADLGFARVNTDLRYARYIGERGQSFSPERFREAGFLAAAEIEAAGPSAPIAAASARLRDIAAAQQDEARRFRAERWPALMAEKAAELRDPERIATQDDVHALWTWLLDRVPDAATVARQAGVMSVRELRGSLLASREGRVKSLLLRRLRESGA